MNISEQKKHSISLFVNNKPGVLIRIALVFARRGYNLESVVVSSAHDPKFARMSLTAVGDSQTLNQIIKQLNKLIDVIHAKEHNHERSIEKEMALIKIDCDTKQRSEILQISEHFKAITVDISNKSLILQVIGSSEKLDAMHTLLNKYKILEYVRSGKLIMARGNHQT